MSPLISLDLALSIGSRAEGGGSTCRTGGKAAAMTWQLLALRLAAG
jgi:hypothetical protein